MKINVNKCDVYYCENVLLQTHTQPHIHKNHHSGSTALKIKELHLRKLSCEVFFQRQEAVKAGLK